MVFSSPPKLQVDHGLVAELDSSNFILANKRKSENVLRHLPVSRLVFLGIFVHVLLVLSIFDIHFQTPVVHGLEPIWPQSTPPAKRLVIFIADGLRADSLFEWERRSPEDPSHVSPTASFPPPGQDPRKLGWGPRAPFLHSIASGGAGPGAAGGVGVGVGIAREGGPPTSPSSQPAGRWGVSHARPPTESRPGHVALLAGFYEDPSAITKGWQANPVEFDHVLNRSTWGWALGSPDIVPLFQQGIPQVSGAMYPSEWQDFSSSSLTNLDLFAFHHLHSLLARANPQESAFPGPMYETVLRSEDPTMRRRFEQFARDHAHEDPWAGQPSGSALLSRLRSDRVVIFLHLLGPDSNGHAHRPHSHQYRDNVRLVDAGVRRAHALVEDFFGSDGSTAYVFTSDHGMSAKGSHGDGDPANTETPLLAWGAGVGGPGTNTHFQEEEDDEHKEGQHGLAGAYQRAHLDGCEAHPSTPRSWMLPHDTRVDVDQADVAPLLSALLGLPCPLNSVGTLPLPLLRVPLPTAADAMLGNTQQLLTQVERKAELASQHSISASFGFRPFLPLSDARHILAQLRAAHAQGDAAVAVDGARRLAQEALRGLLYYHTYDQSLLQATITLAYFGWMLYLTLHLLTAFSHPASSRTTSPTITTSSLDANHRAVMKVGVERGNGEKNAAERAGGSDDDTGMKAAGGGTEGLCGLRVAGWILLSAVWILLLYRGAPPLYFFYFALPILLWTEVLRSRGVLLSAFRSEAQQTSAGVLKTLGALVAAGVTLEVLAWGFHTRQVHTAALLIVAAGISTLPNSSHRKAVLGPLLRASLSEGAVEGFLSPGLQWRRQALALSLACLSIFTVLPVEHGEQPGLVVAGGFSVVVLAGGVLIAQAYGWSPMESGVRVRRSSSAGNSLGAVRELRGDDRKTAAAPHHHTSPGGRPQGVMGIFHRMREVDLMEVWRMRATHFRRLVVWMQVVLVLVSVFLAWDSTRRRTSLTLGAVTTAHQAATWLSSLGGLVLPLWSSPRVLPRLTSVFLGTAPAYILFSIAYEPLFLSSLAFALLCWVLIECRLPHASASSLPHHMPNSPPCSPAMMCGSPAAQVLLPSSSSAPSSAPAGSSRRLGGYMPRYDSQRSGGHTSTPYDPPSYSPSASFASASSSSSLGWADARLALAFMCFNNMAFFGTGNFASIASFELSSVYRFTTQFNAHIMGALVMTKLFIPYILVTCSFSALLHIRRRPRWGVYFLVLILSDVLSIHFFFQVHNTGSWMHIGNSLSRFGILNAQVIFILVLFCFSYVYTRAFSEANDAQVKCL